ncbi:hypothetical protein FPZ12_039945 [Amycolatopsis acidicola]|uniref:Uncharacterized protein n=1 Tax=Amycolatopsis acidicola TaxID=2596893 RepID=A0A5N0ULX8_9PSEU|nr:hypothetical protein [Amycolatopsis acidicola]KAA9151017.1 hypothetical protein FPZ12_039945 [Amycolatopsis acidicola]
MDDVWGGERGRRVERALLRSMADGGDPHLAELAREVLDGRFSLREAAYSSAYAEILREKTAPLAEAWRNMSELDRADAVANAEQYERQLLEQCETAVEPAPPERGPREDEDFSERTYRL